VTVLLLHGAGVDEFFIEIVLPLAIFIGLYRWADRKGKRAQAARDSATPATREPKPDVAAKPE